MGVFFYSDKSPKNFFNKWQTKICVWRYVAIFCTEWNWPTQGFLNEKSKIIYYSGQNQGWGRLHPCTPSSDGSVLPMRVGLCTPLLCKSVSVVFCYHQNYTLSHLQKYVMSYFKTNQTKDRKVHEKGKIVCQSIETGPSFSSFVTSAL